MLKSLSARLLVLVIVFAALVNAVITLSSVSRYRYEWLEERLFDAQIASMAILASPHGRIDPALAREVLDRTLIEGAALHRADGQVLVLGKGPDSPVRATYDLRAIGRIGLIRDGWRTMLTGSRGEVRVTGNSRGGTGGAVSVVIDEAPLRAAMMGHARHLLMMSLLVSFLVAGLAYAILIRSLVRPLQKLTAEMVHFSAAPDDPARVTAESDRPDEIGALQRSLRAMQDQVRHALAQRQGLASLGEAVAKVNHDLRNILATARLVSNRLSQNDDPGVRTISVTLMRAIDRAIELCSDTLKFGRPQDLKPRVIRFALHPLADEVGRAVGLSEESNPMFLNHVSPYMEIEADPEHLFRALQNLIRNAVEAIGAGFGEVAIRCYDMGTQSIIELSDTGPGLPDHARDNLFKPFKSTTHAHGAGLGLVNVREIMRAHGGDIRLIKSDGSGTVFRLHLPLSQAVPDQREAG